MIQIMITSRQVHDILHTSHGFTYVLMFTLRSFTNSHKLNLQFTVQAFATTEDSRALQE